MKHLARIGVIVVFLGLLVALRVLNNRSTPGGSVPAGGAGADSGPRPGPEADRSLTRYGLDLREVSRSAGIDFVHQAPKLDPKLDHIMPQIASMGASVAVAGHEAGPGQ